MNWYIEVLKKYAVFSGRARRQEYWMYFLFNVVIACVLIVIDGVLGFASKSGFGVGPLYGLYALATLIPSIAVTIRRLHDTSRSGWWLLIGLVPIIGGLALLVFVCQDSQPGGNEYGANPKAVTY